MKFKLWAGFIAILVVVALGVFAWWWFVARWQPKTIVRHQAEIAQLLEKSGWVAPPGAQGGAKLYQISFRACPDCIRYRHEEWPKLHAAGVQTRLILIARPDSNGQSYSTPAERATVAELWVNRDWSLMERWDAVPAAAWTAPGVPPADGDDARTAVVETGRQLIDKLTPLLRENGVITRDICYPMLIWWDKEGRMRASGCMGKRADRYIRDDLGA